VRRKPHALVIGGTGMLRWACTTLASRGGDVTVVARDPRRLHALATEAAGMPGQIAPVSCDYGDPQRLRSALEAAVRERGRPDPTIAWMRDDALEGLHAAARVLEEARAEEQRTDPCRLVHVLPSAARSPVVRKRYRDEFGTYGAIRYRQVVLGFVIDEGISRWLTDTEISNGVLRSLELPDSEFVVGRVHPWSRSPGF
jgi:hypothetical protein